MNLKPLKTALLALLTAFAAVTAVYADVIAPEPAVKKYWPYYLGFGVFVVIIMVTQYINHKRGQ